MSDKENLQTRICRQLLNGRSITAIGRQPDMPDPFSIIRLIATDGFRKQYLQMRAERIKEIKRQLRQAGFRQGRNIEKS